MPAPARRKAPPPAARAANPPTLMTVPMSKALPPARASSAATKDFWARAAMAMIPTKMTKMAISVTGSLRKTTVAVAALLKMKVQRTPASI